MAKFYNDGAPIGADAIDQFLAAWKKDVFTYYVTIWNEYKQLPGPDTFRAAAIECGATTEWEISSKASRLSYENQKSFLQKLTKSDARLVKDSWDYEELTRRLGLILDREVATKRKVFLKRITDLVGTITDISFLTIGCNGEINGYVIGDRGRANVRTIMAGGPVQRLHYRVLVKW